MKVTFELTERQVIRCLTIMDAPDKQTDAVMAAVEKTPEIDITRTLTDKEALYSLALLAIATIAEDNNIE